MTTFVHRPIPVYMGYIAPGETHGEMKLDDIAPPPSKTHKSKYSSPGSLRSSMIPLGHRHFPQYFFMSERERKNVSFKSKCQRWGRIGHYQAGSINHYTTPPPPPPLGTLFESLDNFRSGHPILIQLLQYRPRRICNRHLLLQTKNN